LENGYYLLEDYPLEAKVALACTGNQTPVFAKTHALSFFMDKRLDMKSYNWNTVSINTLSKMREIAGEKRWLNKEVGKTIGNIEYYFYFNKGYSNSTHWEYTGYAPQWIVVDGERVGNSRLGNMDYLFSFFIREDKAFGGCSDEAAFINAWSIALGIPTQFLVLLEKKRVSHTFLAYYNPQTSLWTSYEKQLDFWWATPEEIMDYFSIFRPPVIQDNYPGRINYNKDPLLDTTVYLDNNAFSLIENKIKIKSVKQMLKGIPTSQMKQWLLYSNG